VLEWPGQLIIAGAQTFWTQEVTDALTDRDLNGYFTKLLSQVTFLINLHITFYFSDVAGEKLKSEMKITFPSQYTSASISIPTKGIAPFCRSIEVVNI